MKNNTIELEKDNLRKYEILLNPNLKKEFEELIFKQFCHNNEFAYINSDKIFRTISTLNIFEFDYRLQHFNVKLPKELSDELWHFSQPVCQSKAGNFYQFNFLIVNLKHFCTLENGFYQINKKRIPKNAVTWVEILQENDSYFENKSYLNIIPKIPVMKFKVASDFPKIFKVDYVKETLSLYSPI